MFTHVCSHWRNKIGFIAKMVKSRSFFSCFNATKEMIVAFLVTSYQFSTLFISWEKAHAKSQQTLGSGQDKQIALQSESCLFYSNSNRRTDTQKLFTRPFNVRRYSPMIRKANRIPDRRMLRKEAELDSNEREIISSLLQSI